jgi:hypothetical protein
MALRLQPGQPRNLRFAPSVRSDLKLLEVTEELLAELGKGRCGARGLLAAA